MAAADYVRYGLWLGVAATAHANRRHYRLPTTWVPHLVLNTAALLLPDLYALIRSGSRPPAHSSFAAVVDRSIHAVVQDTGQYVLCIAPFTAGYLFSNPRFDIYKGDMGEIRVRGFGLDALPHCATAAGLCLLMIDALPEAAAVAPAGPLGSLLRLAGRRPMLSSGVILALLTAMWETGEFMAYRYELDNTGDPDKINMVWSVGDMARDTLANAAGWAIACLLDRG